MFKDFACDSGITGVLLLYTYSNSYLKKPDSFAVLCVIVFAFKFYYIAVVGVFN